jgi:adenylyltransferase/sulfurtransferase
VLVVGAGGLGCPAAIYLVAAGVGHVGILDDDCVDLSNLHRQILHTEARQGQTKASSARTAASALNSAVRVTAHETRLTRENALELAAGYDILVDASDNAPTRYLLNDVAVLLGKPLVSGSALRAEGQLTTYHHSGGPCYRCLFPVPPPAETVTNCSDGGVLGVVPGIVGTLQALETLRIILRRPDTYAGRLLLVDAWGCAFRTIKLRPRSPVCAVCGDAPTITRDLLDYEEFCHARACDSAVAHVCVLGDADRVSGEELERLRQAQPAHVLLDVRPPHEFAICALPSSHNLPMKAVERPETLAARLGELLRSTCEAHSLPHSTALPVFVVCRRGNDSQHAVRAVLLLLQKQQPQLDHGESQLQCQEDAPLLVSEVRDLKGGLLAWSRLHPDFPVY